MANLADATGQGTPATVTGGTELDISGTIIDQWMEKINAVNKDAIVLVVVNPVDVLTYRAFKVGGDGDVGPVDFSKFSFARHEEFEISREQLTSAPTVFDARASLVSVDGLDTVELAD